MPLVRVQLTDHYSSQQKQNLMTKTSVAVQEACDAKPTSTHVFLQEIDRHHHLTNGADFGVDFVRFNIDMLKGRTPEQKADLIHRLYQAAISTLHVDPTQVLVHLHDVEPHNISTGNGKPAGV